MHVAVAHTHTLSCLKHILCFQKASLPSLPSMCIHWWTSMNQVPQLAALQAGGQYSNYSHEKGISETPPFQLTWRFCWMRAGVTLLGMTTTLRCTCHLQEEVRDFVCACSPRTLNICFGWVIICGSRDATPVTKISTGVTQSCIVLGPGVSKLKQDSNN